MSKTSSSAIADIAAQIQASKQAFQEQVYIASCQIANHLLADARIAVEHAFASPASKVVPVEVKAVRKAPKVLEPVKRSHKKAKATAKASTKTSAKASATA